MISVERLPKDLGFASKAFHKKLKNEIKKATAYYAGAMPAKTFEFSCYKHEEIKKQLTTLFNGKCAYCDSSIVHITYGDSEHFRPKSIYWWLGYDWDNLLFACEKCNRTAKNNQFPLYKGVKTKCAPGDTKAFDKEESRFRLLVNPCLEDPETFFEYDTKKAMIVPKKNLSTDPKKLEMARTSIDVYGLQRHELVVERHKHIILLLAQVDSATTAIANYNKMYSYSLSIRNYFEANMAAEVKKLLVYLEPSRQYLGLTKQILRKFFKENRLKCPF
ncbi:retron system putative HNH endonuclease [Chryseolinea lacunae]|uniref:TIGR02646 family protein n=1 Tax=Chryseolinea lacunae TaxID=2801331 RepID=A0ABS1KZZ5_9BACT|nr:retron system putative HNH endonuclease [Chryseolinea lacunae]MBL0744842.1 TIGR02646 family protein [Chryseolinea lacunae]